jgi:hypothetical protein
MSRSFRIYRDVTAVLVVVKAIQTSLVSDKLSTFECVMNGLVIPLTWPISFPIAIGCTIFDIDSPLKYVSESGFKNRQ